MGGVVHAKGSHPYPEVIGESLRINVKVTKRSGLELYGVVALFDLWIDAVFYENAVPDHEG